MRGGYHVLGETLSEAEFVAFGLEMADCKGVFLRITACKALVCHVEKGVMLLFLDHVADLPPLCFCGVDARRVMCACV